MKKSGILFLVLTVVLSALGTFGIYANETPVIMTVTSNAASTNLANGTVELSGTWSVSTPSTETEKNLYGGPEGEPTIYSGTLDGYATFTPNVLTAGYYKLDLYKILYGGTYSRAVIRVEICHNGETDAEVFNLNEEPEANIKEWIDLGTYYFSGSAGEYVKIINTTNVTARLSSLKLTPSDAQEEIAADRGGIIVAGAPVANSGWGETTGHPRLVTAIGTSTYFASNDTAGYAMYSAQSIAAEGYYDVYFYKIAYNAVTNAVAQINIFHDGRQQMLEVDYSTHCPYTTVWEKLGTYYFSANSSNEYISIKNKGGGILRVGGVKFVKNDAPAQGYEEVIVNAADIIEDNPDAHASNNRFSWPTSSAVKTPDGSDTRYSTAHGASFTFYADELTAGSYKVYYYRAPYTTGNDDNVWLTVNHNGKTDAVSFNNGVSKAQWVCLGEYDFSGATKEENVTLYRVQPHSAKTISTRATAVKFVKNAPAEEGDTYVIPPITVKGDTKGANLAAGGGEPTTGVAALTFEGVFNNFMAVGGYRRYYLPTSGVRPGRYKVYAAATPYNNVNDANIAVEIKHSGETVTTVFDASRSTGYYEIGEYEFYGRGTDEYVELKKVAADPAIGRLGAVKFVRQADDENVPVTGKLVLKQAALGASMAGESVSAAVCDDSDGDGEREEAAFTLRAALYNDSAAQVDSPIMYTAVYNDGVLVDIYIMESKAATIEAYETAHYVGVMPRRIYTAGETVKMFFWNDEIMPMCGSAEFSVAE